MSKVTTVQPSRVTQAEFARMCEVSRKSITKWKAAGRVVMDGNMVDVPASMARLARYRREGLPAPLRGDRPTCAAPTVPKAKTAPKPKVQHLTRGELLDRLKALDWAQPFDPNNMPAKLAQAAQCVGFEVVTSDLEDDGHWGGYQVRSTALVKHHGGVCLDAMVAGHGFELDAFEVLATCREHIWDQAFHEGEQDEVMGDVLADLLPALAYPFGACHRKPS
jgi:hypothetical protein